MNSDGAPAVVHAPVAPPSPGRIWLETQTALVICAKEKDISEVKHPFTKILLKFPLLRLVLGRVRVAFHKVSDESLAPASIAARGPHQHNHTIPLSEVPRVLSSLGAVCPKRADVDSDSVFKNATLTSKGGVAHIEYKEFLVCLSVGNVVGAIEFPSAAAAAAARPFSMVSAAVTEDMISTARTSSNAALLPPAAASVALAASGAPAAASGTAAGTGATAAVAGAAAPADGSLRAPSLPRSSFTQAEALVREGSTDVAAAIAASAARRLHSHELHDDAAGAGALRLPSAGAAAAAAAPGVGTGASGGSPSTAARGAGAADTPQEDHHDPAQIAWAFHLMLEAFLQLSHGGVIKRGDLHSGMTALAMLSPSAKTRDTRRRAQPVRTHEIAITVDDASGSAVVGASIDGPVHAPHSAHSAGAASRGGDAAESGRSGGGSSSGTDTSRVDASGRRVVPASALEFLTQERWAELDWNANGEISFCEWVAGFLLWAEVDDDSDSDDEAAEAAAPSAAATPAEPLLPRSSAAAAAASSSQ